MAFAVVLYMLRSNCIYIYIPVFSLDALHITCLHLCISTCQLGAVETGNPSINHSA